MEINCEHLKNLKGVELIQAEYELKQEYMKQMKLDIQNDIWNSLPDHMQNYIQGQYNLALKREYEQGLIDKEYSYEAASIDGEIKTFEKLFGKHNLEAEVWL